VRRALFAVVSEAPEPAAARAPVKTFVPARRLGLIVYLTPLALGLLLWTVSLHHLELARMSDMGLVSVLPLAFYAALALIAAGFLFALFAARLREWMLALHAAALVLVVHGTPAITYGTLRYSWAWKHVGIVDYIQRHGGVNPDIGFLDAYHNWPGFFALAALVTKLGGWHDAIAIANWAPVFFELLFAAGVLLLLKALTPDRRLAWLGTLFFLAANWIGQDYFSPQALAYFLYLVVVGLCLRYFSVATASPPPVGLGRRERVALVALVILAIAFVASTHQLTPFMLILALGALVISRRLELRLLPLIALVFTAGWVAYMAVGFLEGNLYWVVDSIGSPEGNANATLLNLASASSGMQHVALVDRALTAFVIVLALAGAVRRVRAGAVDLSAMLLACVPVLMIPANAYGTEMLFRVYFFALPAMAFLAAGSVLPTPASWRSPGARLLAAGASALLLGGLCVAYYGKERLNYFTKDEVRASKLLYTTAAPGSLLLSGTYDYPWAFKHYELYHYDALSLEPSAVRRRLIARPVPTLERIAAAAGGRRVYLVLTRSQAAEVDMTGVMPRGSLAEVRRAVERSSRFRTVYRGPDATIFEFVSRGAAG
jgi:hypothetical protein